jgi:nucleotide-binding universal stress UspA family protein
MSTSTSAPFVILAALDGSPASEGVVALAARFSRSEGAELHLLHVVDSLFEADRAVLSQNPARLQAAHQEHLARAVRQLAELGVPGPHEHLVQGVPEAVILSVATTLRADLVLVGTHERKGFDRLVLGSVSESVMRHAHCPVLVVRPTHYEAPRPPPTAL